MNKCKKIISIAAAATLAFSALALTGCKKGGYKGDDLTKDASLATSALVKATNGGFSVESDDYVYFINGQEDYTAKNSYGKVVKSALMRISKADLANGVYDKAQTVVPSLFTAGDDTSGIYIFGDYVYYATPTTAKNNKGQVQNSKLDIKRARVDGAKKAPEKYLFRLDSNEAKYRFVQNEGDDNVYCLFEEGGALKSYSVKDDKTTVLVEGGSYFYDTENPANPNVYYTMSVEYDLDKENSTPQDYNQIYCVNAAATVTVDEKTATYTAKNEKGEEVASYSFNKSYLEDEDVDLGDYTEYPYVNLGELVLDGIGFSKHEDQDGRFNPDWTEGVTPAQLAGYTYTIHKQANDGVYLTRAIVQDTTSSDTALYYIGNDRGTAWNSITANDDLTVVANEAANAKSGVLVKKGNAHEYLYASGNRLKKAWVDGAGKTQEISMVAGVEGTMSLWKTQGNYLYYYVGEELVRINYTGADEATYSNLLSDNKDYKPTTIPLVSVNDSWYDPEFITDSNGGEILLYSNAGSYVTGGTAYNYIYATTLGDTQTLLDRADKLEEIDEYIEEYEDDAELQTLMRYYFRRRTTAAYDVEEVKAEYDENQQKYFAEFVAEFEGTGKFVGSFEGDYIHLVGKMTTADVEEIDEDWANALLQPEEEESEKKGMPTFAKVLIIVGIVVVLGAAGGVTAIILVKKKKAAKRKAEEIVSAYKRKKIDTTDDKTIDVYADEEEQAEEVEEPVSETENVPVEEAIEEAEVSEEEEGETPVQE